MGFYKKIAQYYDLIFPVGAEQTRFLAAAAGAPPKAILDIACGTGGYAIELAEQGYTVTAVDLDAGMIEAARRKIVSRNLAVDVRQGDMLELSQMLPDKYDLAFCIGNSLVHLDGEAEIAVFFRQVRKMLTADGKFGLQTVNYDRVLAKDVRSLPTIDREEAGLRFRRMYRYERGKNKIFFKTILEVEKQVIENEIPLYPILANEVVRLLRQAGFTNIRLFGNFRKEEFDKENSAALIIIAQ